jgi:gamma-glutamylcyclotransferase (GGCT)/AIG2-like uncharacterized protein YtfP
MNPITSKETFKGKINIYGTMDDISGNTMIIVGFDGKKKEKRKVTARHSGFSSDFGFTFDNTIWFLNYDFNLKLDESGEIVAEEEEADERYPVFVYGTLRKNMWNHYIIEGMYDKGEKAITRGVMYHNGSYPYLFEGNEVAKGEVYFIKKMFYERAMMRLDGLEGYHGEGNPRNHYNRKLIDVAINSSGEIIKAWCYFANDTRYNHLTLIKDGDFVRWATEYSPGRRW